jgi:hypothetical protein
MTEIFDDRKIRNSLRDFPFFNFVGDDENFRLIRSNHDRRKGRLLPVVSNGTRKVSRGANLARESFHIVVDKPAREPYVR